MKLLCVFGKFNYGIPSRGIGYEYSNFIPAFLNLGYEVKVFDSWFRGIYRSFAELNLALINEVLSFKPDVVFCVPMLYEVWLETYETIRNLGIKLVAWATDDSWKYTQLARLIADKFDVWITTSHEAYRKACAEGFKNFFLSQWAISTSKLLEPLKSMSCLYDVTFIGSAYGNRREWINFLQASGIHVTCFGYGWQNGAISDSEIGKIINQSKISLNFSSSGLQFRDFKPYRSYQIKARVFEITGYGGCLLTEHADYLNRYYEIGCEVETFKTKQELIEKIYFLLSNPSVRDTIAQRGYHKTAHYHTYEYRFKEIFDVVATISVTPSTNDLNSIINRFKQLAVKHKVLVYHRFLKTILSFPFIVIFGKQRGLRALRRLLFELSWRLFGKRVYSAKSILGRLFYHES